MRNADYWRGRSKMIEEAAHKKGEEYLEVIEREFKKAMRGIQDDIEKWYARFAENNQITLIEAKKWLNTRQLAELRWSVEEYIKYGMQNALDGRWMKQLENASARRHINRLEALQLQLQQHFEVLYGNQLDGLDGLLRHTYSEGYYHTAFEIQRGVSVGWDLHALDTNRLDRVLTTPWSTDNRTFRDRCWTNKQELVATVQTAMTQMIIRGDSPDKAIDAIAKRLGVARNKASRLVMTESAYMSACAQRDCYKELGVEHYEIVGTLDRITCSVCGDMDGRVFRETDFEPGVTANPFHPSCRCCTAPYFADMAGFAERAVRGADGKTHYIPANVKYNEWKDTFVGGGN